MQDFSEIHERLYARYLADPEGRQAIDRQIWEEYGRDVTVFISDSSGFSRITAAHGILQFLSIILKLRELAIPIIERNQGRLIKAETDNLIAVFPHPDFAIRASRLIHEECHRINATNEDDLNIISCHGISTGKVLMFSNDVFGHAVNIASKLGEDLAGPFQTLISADAATISTQHEEENFEFKNGKLSGISIDYWVRQY